MYSIYLILFQLPAIV